MIEVRVTETLPVAARRVWDAIGDPAALAGWHPAIAASPVVDGVRRCTLANGVSVTERVLSCEDLAYSYTITDGLPVRDYVSKLSVVPVDGGALVTWEGRFETSADPAEMRGLVEGVYRAGLGALQEKFAS